MFFDTTETILTRAAEIAESRGGAVIGIDGRSASGKTTLAAELAEKLGAGVIHADDFFLPPELRTPVRYAEPGGNLHYERFKEEVADKISGGIDGFCYHIFDCATFSAEKLSEPVRGKIKIIEGAYCTHPRFDGLYDLKIFCDVEAEEQRRRILARNGAEKLAVFTAKWIPLEESYIAAFSIDSRADIIFRPSVKN